MTSLQLNSLVTCFLFIFFLFFNLLFSFLKETPTGHQCELLISPQILKHRLIGKQRFV